MEAVEELTDTLPSFIDGSRLRLAQQGFEFGEGLLDRIEIRGIGRQEEELGSGLPDRLSHGLAFV